MSAQAMKQAEEQTDMDNTDPNNQISPVRFLEALLFASSAPLSIKDMHERMPEGTDVGGALMALQNHYKDRGVNLVEMEGHWAFRTAADLGDALQVERAVQRKLSRAAMETLAIVAYHQPVTRAEIENIRGVATHKGTLDALMEMGWVKPGRRRETPGRPLTWVTTSSFLDHFSLEAVTDLPGLDDLKASGLLDRRPAIEAIPGSRDLFSGQDEGIPMREDPEDESDYVTPEDVEEEFVAETESEETEENSEEELEEI